MGNEVNGLPRAERKHELLVEELMQLLEAERLTAVDPVGQGGVQVHEVPLLQVVGPRQEHEDPDGPLSR